jgi:hypothetical protein
MCDGCHVFAGMVLEALRELLFPNSHVSTLGTLSFFQISHDFGGRRAWIGHLRLLRDTSVWAPVKSRNSGSTVLPGGSVISDSQVIWRNSRHWLTLWIDMGLFFHF